MVFLCPLQSPPLPSVFIQSLLMLDHSQHFLHLSYQLGPQSLSHFAILQHLDAFFGSVAVDR